MTAFEIVPLDTNAIQWTPGEVSFPSFETVRTQALKIAEFLTTVDVTPETIKASKKMLAAERKIVKSLDTQRIAIKKAIMSDYLVFESQVKEIKQIVDDGDSAVRSQIRALEEAEREEKKTVLFEIFEKRAPMYPIMDIITTPFLRWLQPSHLNKTTSLAAAEKDMTAWLEKVQTDWDTIGTLEDSEWVRAEYLTTLNLVSAITAAKARKEAVEALQSYVDEDEPEEVAVFVITGHKDICLSEMLLRENGINFKRK